MTRCPKCGAEFPHVRQFCGKCAARMGVRCGFCGFLNTTQDTYCGGCSADLASAQPPGAQSDADMEQERPRLHYDALLEEAHEDRSFTAQIAETLEQAELRELFHKDDE